MSNCPTEQAQNILSPRELKRSGRSVEPRLHREPRSLLTLHTVVADFVDVQEGKGTRSESRLLAVDANPNTHHTRRFARHFSGARLTPSGVSKCYGNYFAWPRSQARDVSRTNFGRRRCDGSAFRKHASVERLVERPSRFSYR